MHNHCLVQGIIYIYVSTSAFNGWTFSFILEYIYAYCVEIPVGNIFFKNILFIYF